ncbi:MAG: DUF4153 domain-containing protein [Geobacter sp.]|nr:DUF4153 domain-containing protein [Geobacter sp.]
MLISITLLSIVLLLIFTLLSRSNLQGRGDSDRLSMVFRLSTTIRRFPFAVVASVFGTTAGVVLAGKTDNSASWKSMLGTALLALPLLVAARLLSEKDGQKDFRPNNLTIAVTALGCVYFIFLSQVQGYGVWYRHSLWTIAAFLVILLFPFYKRAEEEEFWHFNATLVYAFAIAVISAFALFSGISAALAGVNYLLGVKVPGEAYLRLWIVMAGFVAVLIFLSAIPTDIWQISQRVAQSKIFERFIRFILVPLVALYLVILYIYTGRIVIQGSWPKGGVAGFILGFSSVGIVTYLLSYGVTATENRLQSLFRKLFFPLVLPLTPMLFLSVWRRVTEYGVTETRYFGILSAFWLAAVSLYFIVSRRKDLRIVPASLCLIIILVSFGPWGALSTSARSQTGRLQRLLQEAGVLINGTLRPPLNTGSPKVLVEINKTIIYLHKIGSISPLTDWSGGKIAIDDKPETIASKIGINFALQDYYSGTNFDFSTKPEEGTDVSGYRYLWQIGMYRYNIQEITRTIGARTVLRIKPAEGLQKLSIAGADDHTVVIDLAPFVESLIKEYPDYKNRKLLPSEKMTIDLPQAGLRLAFSEINGSITDRKPVINTIKGMVMYE